MNIWLYVGYLAISCIGFLLLSLIMIGIFICVDNYFDDKEDCDMCDRCSLTHKNTEEDFDKTGGDK